MPEIRKVVQINWGKLLSSEFGTEGLLYLRELQPRVAPGDSHNIIFQAGVAEGYARCLEALSELPKLQTQKAEDFDNK